MKNNLFLLAVFCLFLASCVPSEAVIQAAISKTQTAQTAMASSIQTAIAQTQAAAPTMKPMPTSTRMPTPTQRATATLVKPTVAYHYPTATTIRLPTLAPTVSNPVLDITIKVTNQCREQHTVLFDGPVHLKYVVDPGKTVEWQAARGTYSWTVDGVPGQQSPMELHVAVWTLTLCY